MDLRKFVSPSYILDLVPAEPPLPPFPSSPPDLIPVQQFLLEKALNTFRDEVAAQRKKDTATIAEHLEISMRAIIDRVNLQFADLMEQQASGSQETGLEGRLKQVEDRLDELNGRLDRRRQELKQECQCTLAGVSHRGRAWVLPHPDRQSPGFASMVSNAEIERIAVEKAI